MSTTVEITISRLPDASLVTDLRAELPARRSASRRSSARTRRTRTVAVVISLETYAALEALAHITGEPVEADAETEHAEMKPA